MKAIAATLGEGSRRDFFWLNQEFGMMASSPVRGLGFNVRFGGIFTSVPAAVASMARPPRWVGEILEGPTASRAQRTDLFGLGRDYAMYHKALWGAFDQDDLSSWEGLGGVFTSAPAAIAWRDRINVFGVGLDHAMYMKVTVPGERVENWTAEWQRLGGSFTSTASLVVRTPNQLDVFARGADFTLRENQTDGATWFGWQNHGGSLASPPVAVSWGPDRLDIFAVFKDGALWHRWWDGQIWNEWESLGGDYVGEPAVASWGPGRLDVFVQGTQDRAVHHHSFRDDTWSRPEPLNIGTQQGVAESPTVIAAPNRLELLVPTNDHQIRLGSWDGRTWQFRSAGATFRSPSRYRLSVDKVRLIYPRALATDTDAAMACVTAGNAINIKTQWIGELGAAEMGSTAPNSSDTNLLTFDPVTVDLAEPMSFSYLVVNNGHAPQDKVLAALANGGNSLSLAGSSSMTEDIEKGVVKVIFTRIREAISIDVPVVGSIVSFIAGWIMDKLQAALFESCDGLIAAENRAMFGRDLFILTDNGTKTVTETTEHRGTEPPEVCGSESWYTVTWTIKPL